jgi:hypothetical protein
MKCNFTHNHYEEVFNQAKKLGFSFHTMHDFLKENPKNNFIILRHDVDLSLKHALKTSELENSLGLKSTYFVRVNDKLDPFSPKNSEMLRKIASLGHEIGLHYDSDVISLPDFKNHLLDKKRKLENAAGSKIYGAALHKVKSINGKKQIEKLNFVEEFLKDLDLEYDAYSNAFVKNVKYISDSGRQWKEGCMCNHIGKRNLCILTHPIWWSSSTTSLITIIEDLL